VSAIVLRWAVLIAEGPSTLAAELWPCSVHAARVYRLFNCSYLPACLVACYFFRLQKLWSITRVHESLLVQTVLLSPTHPPTEVRYYSPVRLCVRVQKHPQVTADGAGAQACAHCELLIPLTTAPLVYYISVLHAVKTSYNRCVVRISNRRLLTCTWLPSVSCPATTLRRVSTTCLVGIPSILYIDAVCSDTLGFG